MVTRGSYRPAQRPMIVFVVLGHIPWVLLVAQIGMLYLVWIDFRAEPDITFETKLWWYLLVFIFNVLGYIAFRVWIAARRHRHAEG
jgi:hypothetical protein